MEINPRLNEIDDCLYRVAVRALIFHDGKVLMVREKDVNWWSFPGGGIDHGENLRQAFERELTEELGVSPKAFTTDYRVVYATIGAVVHGVPRANLFYKVDIPADRIRAGDDVLEIGWFAPADITPEITSRYIDPKISDPADFVQAIAALASDQSKRVLA